MLPQDTSDASKAAGDRPYSVAPGATPESEPPQPDALPLPTMQLSASAAAVPSVSATEPASIGAAAPSPSAPWLSPALSRIPTPAHLLAAFPGLGARAQALRTIAQVLLHSRHPVLGAAATDPGLLLLVLRQRGIISPTGDTASVSALLTSLLLSEPRFLTLVNVQGQGAPGAATTAGGLSTGLAVQLNVPALLELLPPEEAEVISPAADQVQGRQEQEAGAAAAGAIASGPQAGKDGDAAKLLIAGPGAPELAAAAAAATSQPEVEPGVGEEEGEGEGDEAQLRLLMRLLATGAALEEPLPDSADQLHKRVLPVPVPVPVEAPPAAAQPAKPRLTVPVPVPVPLLLPPNGAVPAGGPGPAAAAHQGQDSQLSVSLQPYGDSVRLRLRLSVGQGAVQQAGSSAGSTPTECTVRQLVLGIFQRVRAEQAQVALRSPSSEGLPGAAPHSLLQEEPGGEGQPQSLQGPPSDAGAPTGASAVTNEEAGGPFPGSERREAAEEDGTRAAAAGPAPGVVQGSSLATTPQEHDGEAALAPTAVHPAPAQPAFRPPPAVASVEAGAQPTAATASAAAGGPAVAASATASASAVASVRYISGVDMEAGSTEELAALAAMVAHCRAAGRVALDVAAAAAEGEALEPRAEPFSDASSGAASPGSPAGDPADGSKAAAATLSAAASAAETAEHGATEVTQKLPAPARLPVLVAVLTPAAHTWPCTLYVLGVAAALQPASATGAAAGSAVSGDAGKAAEGSQPQGAVGTPALMGARALSRELAALLRPPREAAGGPACAPVIKVMWDATEVGCGRATAKYKFLLVLGYGIGASMKRPTKTSLHLHHR